MKTVLRNMQKVARISGATNLIIAHPGKDTSRGLRGWLGQKIMSIRSSSSAAQISTSRCYTKSRKTPRRLIKSI
jgi:hypothetical protein